jgi:hypothetical protein
MIRYFSIGYLYRLAWQTFHILYFTRRRGLGAGGVYAAHNGRRARLSQCQIRSPESLHKFHPQPVTNRLSLDLGDGA